MFLFLLVAEEHQAPLEGVNRNGNFRMVFNDCPSGFHRLPTSECRRKSKPFRWLLLVKAIQNSPV